MALTNDQITAQNFKDFYGQIRPYLNGQVPTFANQFSRSDLYSTSEKIIGCWTDGKPLYQRVFVQSGTISTRTRYFESAFLAANIDNIVERTTNVTISYDGGSSIRGIYWVSNSDYFQCLVEKNGAYPVFSGSGITFSDLTVIVSYTKTTDSAIKVGTGTDYSTDEQIIGTWIDGKPIYQKTVDCGVGPAASATTHTNPNISSDAKIVGIKGVAIDSSNNAFSANTTYINWANFSVDGYCSVFTADYSGGDGSNHDIVVRSSGKDLRNFHFYITIQYTKTTD